MQKMIQKRRSIADSKLLKFFSIIYKFATAAVIVLKMKITCNLPSTVLPHCAIFHVFPKSILSQSSLHNFLIVSPTHSMLHRQTIISSTSRCSHHLQGHILWPLQPISSSDTLTSPCMCLCVCVFLCLSFSPVLSVSLHQFSIKRNCTNKLS